MSGPNPPSTADRDAARDARVDWPSAGRAEADSRPALVEALHAHRGAPVRLIGGASAQLRLPPPDAPPILLRVALAGIVRLEPDDLTCSVAPATPRAELDAALAAAGLWLPCAGAGTIGGLLAADLHAPLAPGAHSARSLLLGLEGVLAEGRPFKSGARVVKSVAGFDLQKLFVGSRGLLFAATMLHLKVRPLPRRTLWFARSALETDAALALFRALRRAPGAVELWLERDRGACAVRGCLAGHPRHLAELQTQLGLEGADPGARMLAPAGRAEVVQGLIRPSRVAALLAALPSQAAVLVNGTGQFEARLEPEQTDALLRQPAVPLCAEVRAGPPERRGLGTPVDPGAARLAAAIKHNLDPAGMLR